jgi:hypothetical protein
MEIYWNYTIQYHDKTHTVSANSVRNAIRKLVFRLYPAKDQNGRSQNTVRANEIFEAQSFKVIGQSLDLFHYIYPIQLVIK